jgi:hypothetical protein
MIVWGGQLNGSDSLNTGARYDPAADSWVATSMGTVPTARLSHTAIWTGSEMIVWGGTTVSGSLTPASNIGGRYDPATDVWVPTSGGANVPTARTLH